ncbi:hypothetical protein EDD86DRAFT_200675 [Gorgonomyces haynaldii]|nr:hypothetical protein EDD86DRAFT_200675 [Gorgonomyces haynaldii]
MLSLSTTRIIVVGDENTGKTALISVLIGLSFPKQHIPTIQDEFETDLIPSTVFVDTPGSSAFDRMRPFSFEGGTDVILVFAKDSPNSFTELEEKVWIVRVVDSRSQILPWQDTHLCRDDKMRLAWTTQSKRTTVV